MIRKKLNNQGYYCTRCQETYAHYSNIPLECLQGRCKRRIRNNPRPKRTVAKND